MQALIFDQTLQVLLDYPSPRLEPGEALIALRLAGICNTDLEITRGYMDYRGVLGHEFVGTVEAVGSSHDSGWVGRRVVGDINAACGVCATCRANRPSHCPNRTTLGIAGLDGVFADKLRLPVRNLVEVPASVPDEQAVFTEPLAAACQILEQLHVRPTDRVLVVGDGKLGLLAAQVLRLTGAEIGVLGRHWTKERLVRQLGLDFYDAPRPDFEAALDVVVECTGQLEGLETARRLVRPMGTLVLKSTYHGQPTVPLSYLRGRRNYGAGFALRPVRPGPPVAGARPRAGRADDRGSFPPARRSGSFRDGLQQGQPEGFARTLSGFFDAETQRSIKILNAEDAQGFAEGAETRRVLYCRGIIVQPVTLFRTQ